MPLDKTTDLKLTVSARLLKQIGCSAKKANLFTVELIDYSDNGDAAVGNMTYVTCLPKQKFIDRAQKAIATEKRKNDEWDYTDLFSAIENKKTTRVLVGIPNIVLDV